MTQERSSEPSHELASADQAEPRQAYATPRLTRWGAIPRVTEADDEASGIPTGA
jgi:hypothetical protein